MELNGAAVCSTIINHQFAISETWLPNK